MLSFCQAVYEGLCSGDIVEKDQNQMKCFISLDVQEKHWKKGIHELKTEKKESLLPRFIEHEKVREVVLKSEKTATDHCTILHVTFPLLGLSIHIWIIIEH